MTLVQLRHLLALARCKSFSQAAEQCFLTQPALSRSIRALEDELGNQLFDRVGRRLELTAFGGEILTRARALIDEAQDLKDSGRQMRAGQAGRIRVGMGSGPGAMLMDPLLLQMATKYPRVKTEISRGGTDLLLQALRQRNLDALVVDVRSVTPSPDLQISLLREMRGAFLCRPGHPLARRRKVKFEELRAYPMASTPLSDEVARILTERYGPSAHPTECMTLRCEELHSLIEVTRRTDAVLLAIRASAPDLVEIQIDPAFAGGARFGLVSLKGRSAVPVLKVVHELIEDLLHD